MKITYTKTYEDTEDHILFGAKHYGYQETINDPADTNNLPHEIAQVPNPQPPEDFMKEKIDEIVKEFITVPIRAYVKEQARIQAEGQANQMAEVVIANIK